ncbi:MAG: thiopurine S-methyltransferase [Hyphomicrobiaceae bacterium]|nr:thiopurine S-methyltransferase [Hyphomicrobiaceae bacterium]
MLMDPDFWHQRWQSNEIGFHEGRPNALLQAHWSSLGVGPGSTVLVPLCGKTRDMAWLAAKGHRVIGVELSDIAARDFFAENGLEPERVSRDGFDIRSAGGIEIWCGDLFALRPAHLAGIDAVYDRASLVAMPPAMQVPYAAKLAELVPGGVPILLIAFDYDQSLASGPPFATSPARVRELFEADFEIVELERRDALESSPNLKKRGLTWLIDAAMKLARRG